MRNRKKWSSIDIDVLKLNLNRKTYEQLAKILNRGITSISEKITELGLKKIDPREWSESDTEFLLNNHDLYTVSELSKRMNKSIKSIYSKLKKMKITHMIMHARKEWTVSEIEYLRKNHTCKSVRQMSIDLKRTDSSVKLKLRRIKESSDAGFNFVSTIKITQDVIAFIERNHKTLTITQMSKGLGNGIGKRTIKKICADNGWIPFKRGLCDIDSWIDRYDNLTGGTQEEKKLARQAAWRAVKRGVVKKEACRCCGCFESQAHHEDYSKPFEIIWLCKKCHDALHSGQIVI